MPLYQQIIVTIPNSPKQGLVSLFKKFTSTVLKNNGTVRGIENHGLRPLAERGKRKYATTDGDRYFWEARYCTVTFDASPKDLPELDRLLKADAALLKTFTVKQVAAIDRIRDNTFRNPYIKSA